MRHALEGRDVLIRELQELDEDHEHFHLMPKEWGGAEIEVSLKAYRSTDRVLECGKVYFRADEWDREYFPHVLEKEGGP